MRTSTSTNMGALLILLVLLGAFGAGCGDSDSEPEDPQISAAVAGRLAELSDEAADELAAGDACAAEETVDELEHQVELTQAEVPRELRGELEAGVQKLAAKVDCVPLPPVTEEPEPEPAPEPVEEKKPEERPKEAKPEEEEEKCPPGQEQKGESGCVAKDNGGEGSGGNGGTGGTGPGSGEEGGDE